MAGHYSWKHGEPAPVIGEHSLSKHDVLRRYLQVYVDVLTADPRRQELRVTLVDGFSGGGLYRHPKNGTDQVGSPLIMLRAMEEAEFAAQSRRTKPGFQIDARFFFVERDKSTLDYLRHTINDPNFANKYKSRVTYVQSTFREAAPAIIESITKYAGRDPHEHRCIFLLDQYGWKDVPLDIIQTILKTFHKAEILLTFSTDKLINFFSSGDIPTLRGIGLHGLADRLPSLVNAHPSMKRRLIQQTLTEALIQGSGAKFYTPFFIRPGTATNNDYWFIHLSNHVRARDEMTKLHWSVQNSFAHYGEVGLNMLGYDPRKDDDLQGQVPIFAFDNDAKPRTETALREQIVRRIAEQWPQGTSFGEIVRILSNETPAHKGIMHDVLRSCVSERELDLINGETHRPKDSGVKNIADGDILRFRSNMLLDLKPRE